MPRRGKRKRIAKGVYEDATGRSITYRDHAGRQREIRFPPETPIRDMREEAARRKSKTQPSGDPAARRGTLGAAVDAWAPQEQTLASWRERRAELRAWCKAIVDGDALRTFRLSAIDARIARTVMSQWAQAGVKPKTIRNRRWSLQHLYHLTLGPNAPTPVDDIPPPAKTKTIPIAVDPADVLTVYRNLLQMEQTGALRDAKTRARFMVRASTGKRPSEIMRAKPSDVSLERREWRVRDGKGGWSEGLYLNDDMLEAWRVFIEADAWDYFDTSAHARTLHTAGWPLGLRPYELRHSAGIALSDAGIDLADISGFLGHTDLRTTRQTYVPIRRARMQRASEALEGRFAGWKAVPAPVPASRVDKRKSMGKNVKMALSPSDARKTQKRQHKRQK